MKKLLLLLFTLTFLASYSQPYVEGFETFPPEGWTIYNHAGPANTWQTNPDVSSTPPFVGNYAAYCNGTDGTSDDWLVSPSFIVQEDAQISFYSMPVNPEVQGGLLSVFIFTEGDPANPADYDLIYEWGDTPDETQYVQRLVNIPSSYVGLEVRIAFVVQGFNGDGWLLDEVQMYSGDNCPMPIISLDYVMPDSITVHWTATGSSQWEVEVVPEGVLPTGNGILVTSNTYTATGLTAQSQYTIYVRKLCGGDEVSEWSHINAATNLCTTENSCPYSFQVTSPGNGSWDNPGVMYIKQNGVVLGPILLNGNGEWGVWLCNNQPFELEWPSGSGPNEDEVGISIKNSFNQTLFEMEPGTGEQGTTIYTGFVNCSEPVCLPPAGLSTSVENLDVTIRWEGSPEISYQYYVVEQDAAEPDSQTEGIAISATEAVMTNLMPNTAYKFYVRMNCEEDGFTAWTGPFNFTLGTGNILTGTVKVDSNGDGNCGTADTGIPSVELVASLNGVPAFSVYTNSTGEYMKDNMPNGIHTITMQPVPPQGYGSITPISETITFGPDNTVGNISFCLPISDVPNDVEVILSPLGEARPGLYSYYNLSVINHSPLAVTGSTVTVVFDDVRLAFNYADIPHTIDGNTVTINLGAVEPYGTVSGSVVFFVHPPMVNMGGEELVFTTNVGINGTDNLPENNTHVLNQIIVNSYDPNDITCHQGSFITEDQASDYLTYTIRFQNTGTADAINIRLKNTLDTLLDWDTFQPITASHQYYASRSGGQLQFDFTNIHLPAEEDNEPGSHGFITYRIKPKSTFGLHDIISNSAEIYFDFNPAIITNTATTEVITTMGRDDFSAEKIIVYPNPVYGKFNIKAEAGNVVAAKIFDLNGREINITLNPDNSVNAQNLTNGVYLLKVTTTTGTSVHRIIKK